MSLWEIKACVEGYNRANGGEEAIKPPTPEEHDAMIAKYG